MPRVRILLRLLIALSWAGGMVGLAWEIRTGGGIPLRSFVAHTLSIGMDALPPDKRELYADQRDLALSGTLFDHSAAWTTWYWSPMNIGYWALALLYFSPAVFLTLLHWVLRVES